MGIKIGKIIIGIIVVFITILEIGVVLCSMSGLSKTSESSLTIWAEGNTIKIKSDDPVKPISSDGVVVKACRNEYEPFQLIITAGNEKLKNVSVEISDLVDGYGNKIRKENITMFRVWYIKCYHRSNGLGDAGEWPDGLIPFVNPYTPSEMIGIPFDVFPGKNQPIWVKIYVPKNTEPGIYTATISINADNENTQKIPLTLQVWNFTLPDETHIKAVYSIEQGLSLHQYFNAEYNSIEHNKLREKYYDLLADNRLSPGIIYYKTPEYREVDGNVQLDFSESDVLYSHLLDEKHVSAFGIPLPWDDWNECYIFEGHPETTDFSDYEFTNKVKQYFSILYDHFEEKGWIDKHYVYVWDETEWVSDEPFHNAKEGYERVINWSNLIHAANSNLKFLIMDFPIPVSPYWPDLGDYADIWDPYMDTVDIYPEVIRELQSLGKEIWTATNNYADFIDYKATMHRSIAWFAYKYDIKGLDQWDTTYWWSYTEDKIINPWQDDPITYGGNGGGAMIYPGKDIGINGPLPTIRLELNRESVEDYEYLYLLEQLGGKEYAKNITTNILPYEIFSSETSAETFYNAREALAEEIINLQEQQKSNLGTISGRVTNVNRQPIIGAFVSTGISGAITDNQGKYSLTVPAGKKMVTVTTPTRKSCMYPSYYERYNSSSQSIKVNAGEKIENIDFNLVKMQKNSTLISSFEDDIANWTVIDPVSVKQSTENVTNGTYSYKVIFDDARETDMYVEFIVGEGSTFEALEFDIYNAENEFTSLYLYMGENWEYEKYLNLPPKTAVHISIPLWEIEAKINIQGETILGFCADNIEYSDDGSQMPLGKKTLYFDNIRLIGEGNIILMEY